MSNDGYDVYIMLIIIWVRANGFEFTGWFEYLGLFNKSSMYLPYAIGLIFLNNSCSFFTFLFMSIKLLVVIRFLKAESVSFGIQVDIYFLFIFFYFFFF